MWRWLTLSMSIIPSFLSQPLVDSLSLSFFHFVPSFDSTFWFFSLGMSIHTRNWMSIKETQVTWSKMSNCCFFSLRIYFEKLFYLIVNCVPSFQDVFFTLEKSRKCCQEWQYHFSNCFVPNWIEADKYCSKIDTKSLLSSPATSQLVFNSTIS